MNIWLRVFLYTIALTAGLMIIANTLIWYEASPWIVLLSEFIYDMIFVYWLVKRERFL